MNRESEGVRLAQGIENTVDQIKRLVGSQFGFFFATNITIMNSMLPTPPALCYNSVDNLYYLRYRGNCAGTLDPEFSGSEQDQYKGVLQNKDLDYWMPISSEKWLYKVRNKTELDQLLVDPPAIAFRVDTSRYYYRVGPEGYGGRTGQKQRIGIDGNPMWTGSDYITGKVYVPGPNTANTLYTTMTYPEVVAGSLFTVVDIIDPNTLLPITFQITQIEFLSGKYRWGYIPEFDSTQMVGKKIITQTVPVREGIVAPVPTPPVTDICYVSDLTGTVLVGHKFHVAGTSVEFTITDIDETKWTYIPADQTQFPTGSKITMSHAGSPVMEERDPDAWILNSHLYEDNTQGFI